MSVKIRYPFSQYAKLFHNIGLKFVEQEQAWIGYDIKRELVESKVPDEVKNWVQDFFTLHDFIGRQKLKGKIPKSTQDNKFKYWQELSEEDSLQSCYKAEEESEIRKQILLQIKLDFSHPQIKINQGDSGLKKENGVVYIGGSIRTYHRKGLNNLFYNLSHFVCLSEQRIKSGNLAVRWENNPTNFNGTLYELKIQALVEALSNHYKIPRTDRKKYLENLVDHPDSDLFFNAHMHLVSQFSGETAEDKIEDKITYLWFTEKQGLDHDEAERQVKYVSSQILQRRHKVQVLEAFFEKKLANKYTIEHVKFMFSQQLPYL